MRSISEKKLQPIRLPSEKKFNDIIDGVHIQREKDLLLIIIVLLISKQPTTLFIFRVFICPF